MIVFTTVGAKNEEAENPPVKSRQASRGIELTGGLVEKNAFSTAVTTPIDLNPIEFDFHGENDQDL